MPIFSTRGNRTASSNAGKPPRARSELVRGSRSDVDDAARPSATAATAGALLVAGSSTRSGSSLLNALAAVSIRRAAARPKGRPLRFGAVAAADAADSSLPALLTARSVAATLREGVAGATKLCRHPGWTRRGAAGGGLASAPSAAPLALSSSGTARRHAPSPESADGAASGSPSSLLEWSTTAANHALFILADGGKSWAARAPSVAWQESGAACA